MHEGPHAGPFCIDSARYMGGRIGQMILVPLATALLLVVILRAREDTRRENRVIRTWLANLHQTVIQFRYQAGKEVAKLTTKEEFNTAIDALEQAVNAVGAEISDLKAQIAAGGMTADDEAAAEARIADLTSRLTANA